MIEVQSLSKRFGAIEAVRDVSFVAADGQIMGLLGPNGAGKTTTLRMLYGVMRPDTGSVRVTGDAGELVAPGVVCAHLGVLPDSHGLYPRLTAREHIRYFGRLHGLRGDDLEARIDSLIGSLEMDAIADRRAAGYSQGERMKVALARALVHAPQNIVLDEPTNGLDVMSTRAMRGRIRALRDEGRCVIFSSHVMQEVSALCDVIVIMARGSVVARGTAAQLCALVGADGLEDAFVILSQVDSQVDGASAPMTSPSGGA